MALALVEHVKKLFPDAVRGTHAFRGDDTVVVASDRWHEVAKSLRDDPDCDMNLLVDLTAVDYPDREPRFEVVAHLLSLAKGHRLRIKTQVGDAEGNDVEVASLTDLWASANWMERECYDMFGVRFVGHPDLRRILLYPEFEGYPQGLPGAPGAAAGRVPRRAQHRQAPPVRGGRGHELRSADPSVAGRRRRGSVRSWSR
jgi:NADH-quinone oxidoreductase subunit C